MEITREILNLFSGQQPTVQSYRNIFSESLGFLFGEVHIVALFAR